MNQDQENGIRDPNAASAHAFMQFKPRKTVRVADTKITDRAFRPDSVPESPLENGLHSPLKNSAILSSMPRISTTSSEGIVCDKMFMEPSEEVENTVLNLKSVEQHFRNTRIDSSKSGHGFVPRFTFYSEKTGVVRSAHFESLDINNCGYSVSDIINDPFWIDISCPTTREVYDVAQVFGFHPLTTEDIQTSDTREKCEVFSRYVFVVIKSFEKDQFKPNFLDPITFFICLFEGCVISVQVLIRFHIRNLRTENMFDLELTSYQLMVFKFRQSG